jgi:hypothetical protein
MAKRFLPLFLLPLWLAGCSAHFTNLTPGQLPRNNNNLYPVEVAFQSRQQSLRWDSIKPQVVVGTDLYPMQPVQLMRNRWETLIPVPAGSNVVHYRFKFDYQYNAIPARKADSAASTSYTLRITDQ